MFGTMLHNIQMIENLSVCHDICLGVSTAYAEECIFGTASVISL